MENLLYREKPIGLSRVLLKAKDYHSLENIPDSGMGGSRESQRRTQFLLQEPAAVCYDLLSASRRKCPRRRCQRQEGAWHRRHLHSPQSSLLQPQPEGRDRIPHRLLPVTVSWATRGREFMGTGMTAREVAAPSTGTGQQKWGYQMDRPYPVVHE